MSLHRRLLASWSLWSFANAARNQSSSTASNTTNRTASSALNESTTAGCSLLALFPFSIRAPLVPLLPSEEDVAREGYGLLAAALLAVDHFNTHNDTVVPELNATRECNFSFPEGLFQVFDTSQDAGGTFSALRNSKEFCFTVGSKVDSEALVLSVALVAEDLPGATYGWRVSSQLQGSQFASVSIDTSDYVTALVSYLQRPGNEREYIVFLTQETEDNQDFPLLFETLDGATTGVTAQTINLVHGEQESMTGALDAIQENGFRTIVIAFPDTSFLDVLASEADSRGMLSNEYWWIFVEITIPPEYIYEFDSLEKGSPLDRMLRGSAIFKLLDGFEWNPNDRFLSAWRSSNATFVRRLNHLYPNTTAYQFRGTGDFFQSGRPPTSASFVYDAVIAAGLAKCQANAVSQPFLGPPGGGLGPPGGGEPPSGSGLPPGSGLFPPPGGSNGTDFPPLGGLNETGFPPFGPPQNGLPTQGSNNASLWIQTITNTSFQGASGFVSWNISSRDANSVAFGVFNVRAVDLNASASKYSAVLTDFRVDGEWQRTGKPFIFRDGTTNLPEPTRAIANNNYLPTSVRVTGLFFMAIALALSLACGIFVAVYRKDRVMTASQPEFLYLLCFGSFLFSTSIVTRSFDEGVGLSVNQLSRLCMATPWLVSLGDSVIYLSLFSKLWRVQRVFQFRRGQQVNVRHVIGPFVFFEVAVFVTMITWQIVSPWRWVRVVVEGTPPQTTASCKSEHDTAFLGTLAAILLAVTLLAGWMSWRTRDTPADVSDSARVRFTILTHLQSIVVGVPILVILNGKSQNALFLGFSLLVSTISITSMSFLIVPKMFFILWERKHQGLASSRRNVRITGLDRGETDGGSSSFRVSASAANLEINAAAATNISSLTTTACGS